MLKDNAGVPRRSGFQSGLSEAHPSALEAFSGKDLTWYFVSQHRARVGEEKYCKGNLNGI